jgi:hypothetical protein
LREDYSSRVQVVGAEGVWGQELVRTNETLSRFPTSTWSAGVFIRDEADINLNPSTPVGKEYPILVKLQRADGTVLAQTAACGSVIIR